MVRRFAVTVLRWVSVFALFLSVVAVATEALPALEASATTLPTTVTVPSTSPWQDSGVSLTAGTVVTMTASGTIGGVPDSGSPAGSPWPACVPPTEMFSYGPLVQNGLPCWSLIGKFGTTGQPFEVGTDSTITSPGGELYLSVNDNYFADNSGSWSAHIAASSLVGGSILGGQRFGGGGGIAKGTCDCGAGEPVDPATGDFYESATDVTIPTYGPALTFSRTYGRGFGPTRVRNFESGPPRIRMDGQLGRVAGAQHRLQHDGQRRHHLQSGQRRPGAVRASSERIMPTTRGRLRDFWNLLHAPKCARQPHL